MFCCGQDYVNVSATICCSAPGGESKAHVKKNDPVPVKCCGTELIPESQHCCNGVGYDPLKYVCSDGASAGMAMKVRTGEPLGGADVTPHGPRHTSSATIFLKEEHENSRVHYSFPHYIRINTK